MPGLLELKNISKFYHSGGVVTLGLRKINLIFNKGEFVAVTGESGSGKSTLMNVLSGMDTYEEGEMLYEGGETSCFTPDEWNRYRKENIAFVFQDYNLIDSYTVLQNVELALMSKYPELKKRRKRALELIEAVELISHIKHKCTKLSGGQKQRVAIARALAKDAPVIVADEPTGNLDETTARSIISLLHRVSRDKLLIMVTHDFEDVQDYATRKVRLFDGAVIEDKVIREREAASESGENAEIKTEKKNKFVSTLLLLRNTFLLSVQSIFSMPKKSLLVFVTSFLSALFMTFYILYAYSNVLYNTRYGRLDTVIVYSKDSGLLGEEDITELESVKGVKSAMQQYAAHDNYVLQYLNWDMETGISFLNYYSNYTLLSVDNFKGEMVDYGEMPETADELVLTYGNYAPVPEDIIGKKYEFFISFLPEPVEFTITGLVYSNETVCYALPEALQSLYQDYIEISPRTVTIMGEDWSANVYNTSIAVSDSVPSGTAYLVYNHLDFMTPWGARSDLYSLYAGNITESPEVSVMDSYQDSFAVNIVRASEDLEPEVYAEYYDGNPVLVFNSDDYLFTDEFYLSSNSALVIMDTDVSTRATLNRLRELGYLTYYEYDSSPYGSVVVEILTTVLLLVLIGIVIMGLGLILNSGIYSKLMMVRNKDFSVMRSLGMDRKLIRLMVLFEMMILTVFAFGIFIAACTAFHAGVIGSHNIQLYSQFVSLIPTGFKHYANKIAFIMSFIVIMLQTVLMNQRYFKKLERRSVKQAAVEAGRGI